MKYLLVIFSISSLACNNFLPISELKKIEQGIDLGANVKFCKDLPNEECLCYEGIELKALKIEKVKEPKAIYGKELIETCKDKEDCYSIHENKSCDKLNEGLDREKVELWYTVVNLDLLEVYCTRLLRVDQVETDKSKLVEDSTKKKLIEIEKQQKEQERILKFQEKQDAKVKLKDFDKEKIKKVEDILPLIEEILKVIGE